MSQNTFEILKSSFHVSLPGKGLPRWYQFKNLHPLAEILQSSFQQYVISTIAITIDKIMICFLGGSLITVRLSAKPISECYKILVLGEHGYTYAFCHTSQLNRFRGYYRLFTGYLFIELSLVKRFVCRIDSFQ